MPLHGVPVFKVIVKYGDDEPIVRLVQAPSKTDARKFALRIVSVSKAKQEDMLLAVGPEGIPIEHLPVPLGGSNTSSSPV